MDNIETQDIISLNSRSTGRWSNNKRKINGGKMLKSHRV